MSDFYQDIDTSHLKAPFSDEIFTISSAHFARFFELASMPMVKNERLLFGIRGAESLCELGKWHKEISLKEKQIDHQSLSCLIGTWDTQHNKIAIFEGSTVPYIEFILKQQKNEKERSCNQLSQGLYRYYVGAHEPLSSPKEEGAYRLDRFIKVAVWRNFKEHCVLDACIPGDNIHAAFPHESGFRSAGCQVIKGEHAKEIPTGDYQTFRILSGQSAKPSLDELMMPYRYLLVHSRLLREISHGFQSPRYFQGSEGKIVRDIQTILIRDGFLKEDYINKGYLDGSSIEALYQWQKVNGLMPNGIIDPTILAQMGIEVTR